MIMMVFRDRGEVDLTCEDWQQVVDGWGRHDPAITFEAYKAVFPTEHIFVFRPL